MYDRRTRKTAVWFKVNQGCREGNLKLRALYAEPEQEDVQKLSVYVTIYP